MDLSEVYVDSEEQADLEFELKVAILFADGLDKQVATAICDILNGFDTYENNRTVRGYVAKYGLDKLAGVLKVLAEHDVICPSLKAELAPVLANAGR